MAGADFLRNRQRRQTWNIFKPGELERFRGFASQFNDTKLVIEPDMVNAYALASNDIVIGERFAERLLNNLEREAAFLHEYGHTKTFLGGGYTHNISFNHWMEFRQDTFAAAMQGQTKGMKGVLAGLGSFPETFSSLSEGQTHPSVNRRLSNLDQFDSVLKEIGQDKSIPAKLAHLSRPDQRLARKLLPFEVHSARTLNPNLKERFNEGENFSPNKP